MSAWQALEKKLPPEVCNEFSFLGCKRFTRIQGKKTERVLVYSYKHQKTKTVLSISPDGRFWHTAQRVPRIIDNSRNRGEILAQALGIEMPAANRCPYDLAKELYWLVIRSRIKHYIHRLKRGWI
jgi:hypothetical protein